jgi:hypothetical protein
VALRSRLKETVTEVLALNTRLEAIITVKPSHPSSGFHGKIDFSSPPWHAQAANTVLDLHAWSRDAEALTRIRATLPARYRGGSSANTRKALGSLYSLSEGIDDAVVYDTIRWLEGWCRKAEVVLGEREAIRRLPQQPGETARLCPWCRKDTLRQMTRQGVIFCVDILCRSEDGDRPRAQLEMFDGQWELRWMDGVLGTP